MLKKSIRKSAGRVSVYFPAVIDEYAPFHQSKLLQRAVARPQVAHSPNFPSRTGEIVARTAIEPHLRALLAGNDAEAIVLDFMQPLAA